jgi:cytochrome c biogenesis protein CcmG/thiol:disulfide interchange protein DsbE
MKRWLPLIFFVILGGFFFKGLYLNPREIPSPFIGKPAPAFKLPTVEHPDKTFSPDDMKGKVWLLNVWAPWCVACRQEHAGLMQLAQMGVVPIVGLNWKDKDHEAKALLAQSGDPYVTVAEDLSGMVGIDYGVTGTPETYVIDKQGIIRLKHIAPIDPDTWQNKFLPLIKELNQ